MSQKKPYVHLVDGGVADNLGLRAILDRVLIKGSVWETFKGTPLEKAHKVVFVVVNAETQPDTKWDRSERVPSLGRLPTAFKLPPEEVDNLRDVAHRLLVNSEEYQRLLRDLK